MNISRSDWVVLALLLLLTLAAYSPVLACGFVNWDDPGYVSENPHVLKGLTRDSVYWGLTTTYFANWHPMTWWSYMVDAEMWGDNPFGYHLTNLLWHMGAVVF